MHAGRGKSATSLVDGFLVDRFLVQWGILFGESYLENNRRLVH